MRSPIRTVRSRTAAVVVGCAATAAIATTAFGYTGNFPGYGDQPATDGPDLRSVSIVGSYEQGDGQTRQAKYCFDTTPASVAAGNAFVISTYDSSRRMISTAASPSGGAGNENCVTASFPATFDLTQGTIGTVNAGAVTDRNGKGNSLGSDPLAGSVVTPTDGQTAAPDLLSVGVDNTDTNHVKVTYNYDQIIDKSAATVDNFGYEKANGAVVFGKPASNGPDGAPGGGDDVPATAKVVGGGSRSIIIDFLGDNGPTSAQGFEATAGAVTGPPQSSPAAGAPSTPGTIPQGSTGRPHLVGAAAAGPQQFTLTFDQNISVPNGNMHYYAILDDGTAVGVTANGVGSAANANQLTVTFAGGVGQDPSHVVRILSDTGATTSADGSTPSLASQANVNKANITPGFTNGPDLVKATLDPATSQVTYTFDDQLPTAPPAAGGLTAFAQDGSPIAASASLTTSGNTLVARFPTTVSGAVGFGTAYGAVSNKVNGTSPVQSVSKALIGSPVVVTPPAPVVTTPVKKTYKHYKASFKIAHRVGKIYSGQIKSGAKTCTYNRTLILRKVSKGAKVRYGTAHTNSKGTFKIRRKTLLHATVYVSIAEKKTSTTICDARKSKSFKG